MFGRLPCFAASQPAICSGDQSSWSFAATILLSAGRLARSDAFGLLAFDRAFVGCRGPVPLQPTVPGDLPAHSRCVSAKGEPRSPECSGLLRDREKSPRAHVGRARTRPASSAPEKSRLWPRGRQRQRRHVSRGHGQSHSATPPVATWTRAPSSAQPTGPGVRVAP